MASPMINAAIGIIRLKMPSAAILAKASSTGSSMAWASRPKSTAPAQGSSTAIHRFGGRHDRSV